MIQQMHFVLWSQGHMKKFEETPLTSIKHRTTQKARDFLEIFPKLCKSLIQKISLDHKHSSNN